MTEADIRRIVREEIARARVETENEMRFEIFAASEAVVRRAASLMQDRVRRGLC